MCEHGTRLGPPLIGAGFGSAPRRPHIGYGYDNLIQIIERDPRKYFQITSLAGSPGYLMIRSRIEDRFGVGRPWLHMSHLFVGSYVLATHMVISGWVPTCDSARSLRCYSVASLTDQATGIMTRFPMQSRYPDTELTSPWPILVMPSTKLVSDKYRLSKQLS